MGVDIVIYLLHEDMASVHVQFQSGMPRVSFKWNGMSHEIHFNIQDPSE